MPRVTSSSNQQQNVGASRNESFYDALDTTRSAFLNAGRTISYGPQSAGSPHDGGYNPWRSTREDITDETPDSPSSDQW